MQLANGTVNKSETKLLNILNAYFAHVIIKWILIISRIGRNELDKWCLTGASSNGGWTTWLTGGVDPRVNCIIPMMETFVGMADTLHGHYQALGGWSFAFEDYYREGSYTG